MHLYSLCQTGVSLKTHTVSETENRTSCLTTVSQTNNFGAGGGEGVGGKDSARTSRLQCALPRMMWNQVQMAACCSGPVLRPTPSKKQSSPVSVRPGWVPCTARAF